MTKECQVFYFYMESAKIIFGTQIATVVNNVGDASLLVSSKVKAVIRKKKRFADQTR